MREYPSDQILDNVYGSQLGVNLQRSQVRKILSAGESGTVPAMWDEIRRFDDQAIRAFTFLAIIFSHHELIDVLREAGQGRPRGHISRDDMSEKAFTNLAYAMAEVGLCDYQRGEHDINYDISELSTILRPASRQVEQLLRVKLQRCGWKDPDVYPTSNDLLFLQECRQQHFHEALGMSFREFSDWLSWERPRRAR